MKLCSRCKVSKPLDDFHKSTKDKTGRQSRCKICTNETSRQWQIDNPERFSEIRRKTNYKNMYGLTIEEYDRMYEEQGGLCAICHKPGELFGRRLDVDHDHTYEHIRGLLCPNCNRAIGLFNEDVDILKNAIEYLIEHQI